MPRSQWVILLTGLTAAAALGSASDQPPAETKAVSASSNPVPADDPFPITRIRVSEDQLPDAIKQLEAGPLVRLPRSDFESRVRAAGAAIVSTKAVPRLAEATYTATLAGDDLTGTAEWVILNPSQRPAAFPLDPLRLALHSATWADGRAAAVGVLGPGLPPGSAVWVEGSGRQVLQLKWSAAGTAAAG
ncbi:MAG TPA: hypothetical protein VKE74_31360, partial [Gemmataceae bacterium]|nr:hypothetical protein [Gemmataceae bacterium]